MLIGAVHANLGRSIQVLSTLTLAAIASSAWGLTELKDVSLNPEESKVNLRFEGPIDPTTVKTEFFRDIIQISVRGASVYPAKVVSSDVGEFKKVFAYQYTPKLIRTRITVDGRAENYRGKVRVQALGRNISIESQLNTFAAMEEDKDSIRVTQASPVRVKGPLKKKEKAPDKDVSVGLSSEKEKALLKRIMDTDSTAKKLGRPEKETSSEPRLTGGEEPPSPWGVVGWTLLLASIIIGAAMFLRRMKGKQNVPVRNPIQSRIQQFIAGMSGQSLGMGGLIEVVSSKSLGPKRTITVVKVQDALLVLGITDGNINLITRLDQRSSAVTPSSIDPTSVDGGMVDFERIFQGESEKPQPESPRRRSNDEVRRKIRQRLQGMKSL